MLRVFFLGLFVFLSSLPLACRPVMAASSDLDVGDITADPASPVLGNPAGKTTVVEFFDYRCPHSRLMQPRVQALVGRNRNVRLVLKEWPIFGGPSVYAAEVALAANWQGRYGTVHAALFALPATMDREAIRRAAQGAGVDLARLDADLAQRGAEIAAMLTKNDTEAKMLQLPGTPGFLIGHDVYFGDLTLGQLESHVKQAR